MSTPRVGLGRTDLPMLVSLVALALVSWGPVLLVPTALYWDDWVIAGSDTIRWAQESGLPWVGYLHTAFFALGPWSFKVLALLCTVAIGWLVYLIGDRGLGLSRSERWVLAALVVALPLYATRELAILSTYSWSLALFVLGWWLLVRRSPSHPGRWRFIAAAVLFFVSYTTASLLPFTVLPVAHLALLALPRERPWWRSVLRFAGRFWYVLAAPVLFWVLRTVALQPYGLYRDYNELGGGLGTVVTVGIVALGVLLVASAAVLLAARYLPRPRSATARDSIGAVVLALGVLAVAAYLYLTKVSQSAPAKVVPLALVVVAVIVIVVAATRLVRRTEPHELLVPILAVGLGATTIAVLPYLLVGKIPTFAGWETRHQLLLPFGIAVLGVAAVRAAGELLPRGVVRGLSVATIIGFAAVSSIISLTLVADWNKQAQMIDALRAQPLVEAASDVVFDDQASSLNYDTRAYDFYEYNGWMATAFGNEKRLGMARSGVAAFLDGEFEPLYYAAGRYRFGDWTPTTQNAVLVTINEIPGATWWTLVTDQPAISLQVTPIDDLSSLPTP